MDYGKYTLTGRDFIKQGIVGTCICALTAYTFYRSLAVFIVLLPVGTIIFPLSQRERLKKEREWQLTIEFREAIWLISGFLSAGYSVENSFSNSLPELERMYGSDSMIVMEFTAVLKGLRLNRPVEALLKDFAARSCNDDIRSFAEVFTISKRSGGNMKDIIESTVNIIRDKTSVNEEIKNMTASRKYEQRIMNLLPFAIIIYINLTTDGFLDVMYENPAGRLVMTICLVLTGASYVLSQHILDIRV